MTDKQFYQNCAIAAMQGIQESNSKLGLAMDFIPGELAKRSFDIADDMLKEMHKRMSNKPYLRSNG